MTWPPTWDGPQWKTSRTVTKKAKQKIRRQRATKERDAKADSKRRDGHRCRFPRCGCRKLGLRVESSHRTHKGMGGDPKGLTNVTENLMTLCFHRHKDGRISIDKGTLRWIPVVPEQGANDCVMWQVDLTALPGYSPDMLDWLGVRAPEGESCWRTIAIEYCIQDAQPVDDWSKEVLDELAEMEL